MVPSTISPLVNVTESARASWTLGTITASSARLPVSHAITQALLFRKLVVIVISSALFFTAILNTRPQATQALRQAKSSVFGTTVEL
jgi:hypothetical protein